MDRTADGLAFKARVNDDAIASYRYRVLEPIRFLSERGHAVELYDDARVDRYRAVVFSKAYKAQDQALARRLRAAGRRVVLDLCDDHFFNPRDLPKYRQARADLLAMIALADAVTCSTPALARTVQQEAGLDRTPAVAPDVFEQAKARVGPPTPMDRPARLLWFGRHGSPNAEAGMSDLRLIADVLAQAHASRPFELVVLSDSREAFEALKPGFPVPLAYADWSPDSFTAELGRTDGVVIPLSDNRFVAAKTHNRLSLALSAGAPVVADRLDAYEPFAPFCWLGDWAAGLEAVLLRPDEARARAASAGAYLEAAWSASAVAPLWEAALGLTPAAPQPGRVTADAERPVPDARAWLAAQRRWSRTWLLAGGTAPPGAVADARAAGMLALSVGGGFKAFEVDAALVIDSETIAEDGEPLLANARFLIVPRDLHRRGWASGRSLRSWAVDLPALRRFRDEDRLLAFDLWTGAGDGLFGDFEGEDVPLRLLADAGVREVRSLGLARAEPSCTGFETLPSLLDRHTGGVETLLRDRRLSYRRLDERPPGEAPEPG